MPLASVIKVYVKNIYTFVVCFIKSSCCSLMKNEKKKKKKERKKKRKKIPYLLSFLEIQMCKNVKFRFRLGTIPQKTEQRG